MTLADRHRSAWDDFTLAELLRDEQIDPAEIAVHDVHGTWRYGQLDHEADRIARGLTALRVRRGDAVVVQLSNQVEFVTVCVALFRLGAVPVLAMPSLRAAELGHLLTSTNAILLITVDILAGHDHRSMVRPLLSNSSIVIVGDAEDLVSLAELDGPPVRSSGPDPADIALMLLSGGTTHLPKLIPRSHRDYAFQVRETAHELGVTRGWSYLAAVPVAHNAALGCPGVLGLLRLGGQVVMSPTPAPDVAFGLVERHRRDRPIVTTLMPAILDVWAQCAAYLPVDMSGVLIEVGGAAMDRARLVAAETALGCTVTRWFGMAEGPLCFTRPWDSDRLDHEGVPLSSLDQYRIVDETGVQLPSERAGEIQVCGPTTIAGYFGEESGQSTQQTDDGFFRTGDRGLLDVHGRLHVGSRLDDVINRGGEKVAPDEVESHLRAVGDFDDVAVVGGLDPRFGQRVVACIVARSVPDLAELRTALRVRGLADYKLPEAVLRLDVIPRTAIGKIDRVALAERIDDRSR